nr:hypothetical protein CFP56_22766 [Quercus suber]
MTTPSPTLQSSTNVALSKLILYQLSWGRVHAVDCIFFCFADIMGLEWDLSCCFRECSSILSSGSVGFPSRRFFLRFHKFHNTKEKSAGSAVPAKIKPIKSMKHVLYLRELWFHAGMEFPRDCKAGQRFCQSLPRIMEMVAEVCSSAYAKKVDGNRSVVIIWFSSADYVWTFKGPNHGRVEINLSMDFQFFTILKIVSGLMELRPKTIFKFSKVIQT